MKSLKAFLLFSLVLSTAALAFSQECSSVSKLDGAKYTRTFSGYTYTFTIRGCHVVMRGSAGVTCVSDPIQEWRFEMSECTHEHGFISPDSAYIVLVDPRCSVTDTTWNCPEGTAGSTKYPRE